VLIGIGGIVALLGVGRLLRDGWSIVTAGPRRPREPWDV
jgi:hypothetical protein